MARIELRDCTIRIKDGLSGSALITEGASATAILDSNAVNSDLTFTAAAGGTAWNDYNFEVVANASEGANATANIESAAVNADLLFTATQKEDKWNGYDFETVDDLTVGVNADATLDITAVNSDLVFTAPAVGVAYNDIVFVAVSNGAEDVTYDAVNTFTLEYNAGTSNASTMKDTFDAAVAGNGTWPQFACAIEGDGSGSWEVGDDDANVTSANGVDAIIESITFVANTFTIHIDDGITPASNVTALWVAGGHPVNCANWDATHEGDGTGVLDEDTDTSVGGDDVYPPMVRYTAPNTYTIQTLVTTTADDVATLWAGNPANCSDWTVAIEGDGSGVVDEVSDISAGGLDLGANDTDVNISAVVLNTTDIELVPVGARFTPSTVNHDTIHTVTGRTPALLSPTTNLVFAPVWGVITPAFGDTLNFLPQQIEIKIGEGNLTYTENKAYEYLLDRGVLDTVKEGDEQPLELSLEFVYDYITTGTSEFITPVDALKASGGAAEWVSTSADLCEPYCVNLEIDHVQPCGSAEDELTVLPDFRYESLEFNLQDANISVSGKCNSTEAIVTRS